MRRVEADGEWTLMCPNECPGLADVHGKKFDDLYQMYESQGKGKKTIKAQKLWYAILDAQTETGGPFMLYKDAANGECRAGNPSKWESNGTDWPASFDSQIEPAELGNDQVIQLVYRDYRVFGPRRGRRLQLGFARLARVHQQWTVRLQEATRRHQGRHQELEQGH